MIAIGIWYSFWVQYTQFSQLKPMQYFAKCRFIYYFQNHSRRFENNLIRDYVQGSPVVSI
jgi:hypothetical protein